MFPFKAQATSIADMASTVNERIFEWGIVDQKIAGEGFEHADMIRVLTCPREVQGALAKHIPIDRLHTSRFLHALTAFRWNCTPRSLPDNATSSPPTYLFSLLPKSEWDPVQWGGGGSAGAKIPHHLVECRTRLAGMCSFAGRAVLVVSDVPKHAIDVAKCLEDEGVRSVRVVHASQRKGEEWEFETLSDSASNDVGKMVLFRWTRDAASCLSCMGAVRTTGLASGEAWFSGQLRLFGDTPCI
jgi:hypothetical protein